MTPSTPRTDNVPTRKRRLWFIVLVRVAFAGAVLLTLIVALFVEEGIRGRAAWRSYLEDANARHVKVALAEFVPPPVPDERNFAAIPLFQRVFANPGSMTALRLPEVSGAKKPPNEIDADRDGGGPKRPKVGGAKKPGFGNRMKGERPDLAAWQEYFVQAKYLPAAGSDPAADVLKALEHYAPQWEELREASVRPESRFPVRYEDGVNAAMPHLTLFDGAIQISLLRMAAHLAQGDSSAAYDDARMGMRLYTAEEKEPTLIAGLVRLMVLARLENGIWAGLAQHRWTAEDLAKITADFSRLRLMDDYALAVGSERGFNNLIYDQLVQNGTTGLPRLLGVVQPNQPREPSGASKLIAGLMPTGWLRLSQARTNRYFDEMLNRVSQDPPRIHPERPEPSLPANMSQVGVFERARYILFFTLVPALSDIERKYAYAQSTADQTRMACALERHRMARGTFPDSLDALVPEFLPALPQDVMNGQPLHYRLNGDGGYVLYSVASNLEDDGGKSEPNASVTKQPDWVWVMDGK